MIPMMKLIKTLRHKKKNTFNKSESIALLNHLQIDYVGLGLVFLTPALGGFLYGFDIGATSFVLSMLLFVMNEKEEDLLNDININNNNTIISDINNTNNNIDDLNNDLDLVWWTTFPKVQQGLFVSALSLGALIGSHLVLMYLSHTIGRRMEIRLCSILYIIGTTLNVLSGTIFATTTTYNIGFLSLFLGRIFFGMGVGFIMHGAPAYMAEMTPPQVRGAVVSAKETVIVGGIVLGYFAGNLMSTDPRRWTDLYGVTILLTIPMLLLTFRIPRSKRWLLLHGHVEEALESMQFVYKGDIHEEFQMMAAKIEEEKAGSSSMTSDGQYNNNVPISSLLCSNVPQYKAALTASIGLIIFQQFSGQPSILSYATIFFEAAGWSGNESVITATLMMCISMCTVLLVDIIGRKRLLRTCCIVMMSALIILSITFWGWDDNVTASNNVDMNNETSAYEFTSFQKTIILIAMFVYIGGYQIGFGPITWCIVSEIFPLEIRGKAIALGVELNYLLNFLVQFGFPIIQDTLGWGKSFGIFAIVLATAFIFIKYYVPETTGLTLEEIQVHLSARGGGGSSISDDDYNSNRGGALQGLYRTISGGDDNNKDIVVSEHSPLLLPGQEALLGAVPSYQEMETHLIRTHSDIALKNMEENELTNKTSSK